MALRARGSRLCALASVVLTVLCLQSALGQTVSVLTQHNDLTRDGANPNETILTRSNVNVATFGKLFSLPVDGYIFAQPLYVPNVSIPGRGTHNVLYVATAHDSVFAFDGDSGALYWQVSLGTPVPSDLILTNNILVEVGIISTPVIDAASGTIYVVPKTYENGVQLYRLHALDITTGAEKFGGPVEIAASVSGSAPDGSGGIVTFVAGKHLQRSAVTLVNGIVYLAFSSHQDFTPYHGWVLGYNAETLQQVQVFNDTPNGGEGAIWMGGQGLVADSSNNLYLITSNSALGTDTATDDFGESFLKLVPNGNSLTVGDYFKVNLFDYFNAEDLDLGAGGAFAIPGTNYIAGAGKDGRAYLLDTNHMGGLNMSADQVVQEFQADANGLWGSPAFFHDTMYIWGWGDVLRAYRFNGSVFDTTPSSVGAYIPNQATSGSTSVSSNGTTPGTAIVWATAPIASVDSSVATGILFAYDANDLSNLLWSSQQNPSRDSFGNYAKFVAPTVANGKVYIGTENTPGQIAVFGLLSTDFSLTLPAPSTTVAAGGSAVVSFTVVPVNSTNFLTNVTLNASGLPQGATYVFSPTSIAAGASTTMVTLTINMPQLQADAKPLAPHRGSRVGANGGNGLKTRLAPFSLAFVLLPFACRWRRFGKRLRTVISMQILLVLLAGISACGSTQGSASHQAESYGVTVTGASGSFSHSATFTLLVE